MFPTSVRSLTLIDQLVKYQIIKIKLIYSKFNLIKQKLYLNYNISTEKVYNLIRKKLIANSKCFKIK